VKVGSNLNITVDFLGCLPGKSFCVHCFKENLSKPIIFVKLIEYRI